MLGMTYLNYAGLAPLRLSAVLSGWFPWEVAGNALLPRLARRQLSVRESVAAWLGVRERNVAFLGSTTAALTAVAHSIDWREGDVVLYPRDDFAANVLPWTDLSRHGVAAVAVDDWAAPWPARTRLIAISTVDFSTGDERPWRDVCARARAVGAWTCLDAVQSAGIKPSRTDDVDFWATGTQKWLASGLGLGLLVVHDRALGALDGPWRTYLGAADPRQPDSPPADSARRWELGWVTPTALFRFQSMLDRFGSIGWERVSAMVRERRDRLHEGLLEIGYRVISSPSAWSGIVSLDPAPLTARAVVADGYRRRIVAAERGHHVRLSPHIFTGPRDIDRAIDWLWRARSLADTEVDR